MSEHIVPRTTYVAIFAALLVLTAVTTLVAFFNCGVLNPVVAMSIAVLKATLVVLYFMHLRYSDRLTWIVSGAAVFWLGILFVLILSDYLWRSPAIPGLG
jgi:cytochrome c oxidase subunit IV